MRTESLFRLCIVASILTGLIGMIVDMVVPDLIPKSLSDPYDALSEEWFGSHWGIVGLFLVFFVAMVVATIGLLMLKPWARKATVILTVASTPFPLLMGPIVLSAWSFTLYGCSGILWGIALAMAFFPPLKERFSA